MLTPKWKLPLFLNPSLIRTYSTNETQTNHFGFVISVQSLLQFINILNKYYLKVVAVYQSVEIRNTRENCASHVSQPHLSFFVSTHKNERKQRDAKIIFVPCFCQLHSNNNLAPLSPSVFRHKRYFAFYYMIIRLHQSP